MSFSKQLRFSFLALTLITFPACLKTRAHVRTDSPDAAATSSELLASQASAIDELKTELARLTGRLEELERAQGQASKNESAAQLDAVKKLETRLNELEQAQIETLENLKKVQTSSPAADPVSWLEQGKSRLISGDLEGAAEALSEYLKSSKPRQAEEATFLRGEAYFGLKQYKKAIIDFSKFPERFQKSRKMPEALYKIGLSFDALGMREDARNFFQELIEKFPKTVEAKKAKGRVR
jgi:TolA-binding protein